ncbi:MAG: hypothetical protein LBC60_01285 [Spirochaetaceae bacterium]|jgi:hypothetical protein|nr:hypothetical protein [Spirochaetaceae bacterium]
MKSKSFIAGALGVLLCCAGQNAPAQEGTVPGPDRGASTIPAPAQEGTIPAPGRDTSTIPAPDRGGTIPNPAGETEALPPPEGGTLVSSTPPVTGGNSEAPQPGTEPRSVRETPQQPAAGSGPSTASPEGAAPGRRVPPERGLLLGAMAGMKILSYNTDDIDLNRLNIEGNTAWNGGLFFGADFGKWIGQVEILLTADRGTIKDVEGFDDITAISLLIPLIFKWDLHLGPVAIRPLAGFYLNFALGDMTLGGSYGGEEPYANPPLGFMIGGDVGLILGRGIIFLDLRYGMDLGKTAMGNSPIEVWRRSAFMLNLGYQFLIGRR